MFLSNLRGMDNLCSSQVQDCFLNCPSTSTSSQPSAASAVMEQFSSLWRAVRCSGNCIWPEHSGSSEVFPLERFKAFISLLSTSLCYLHHRTAPENWKMHFLWRPSLMHCIVNLFIVSLQSAWWIRNEVYPNWLLFVKRSKEKKRGADKKLFQVVCDKNADSVLNWTDRITSFEKIISNHIMWKTKEWFSNWRMPRGWTFTMMAHRKLTIPCHLLYRILDVPPHFSSQLISPPLLRQCSIISQRDEQWPHRENF